VLLRAGGEREAHLGVDRVGRSSRREHTITPQREDIVRDSNDGRARPVLNNDPGR
jgi:hypothetical protein